MVRHKLQESLNNFLELKEVQEIIQSTDKEKIQFEVEFDKGKIMLTEEEANIIILSINVNKKQGYSGYRKMYQID